jgi:hypothetical protein
MEVSYWLKLSVKKLSIDHRFESLVPFAVEGVSERLREASSSTETLMTVR